MPPSQSYSHRSPKVVPGKFDISPGQLREFMEKALTLSSMEATPSGKGSRGQLLKEQYGGLGDLAKLLRTDYRGFSGLRKPKDLTESAKHFGSNKHEDIPVHSLAIYVYHTLHDGIVVMLLLATGALAILSHLQTQSASSVQVAALAATTILIIICSSLSDKSRDSKFNHLNAVVNETRFAVRRGERGCAEQIAADEIVVGDVIQLAFGQVMPADGILCECADNFQVNEHALTGCITNVKKGREDPFLWAGTTVVSGFAAMMVVGVGKHTTIAQFRAFAASKHDLSAKPSILGHQLDNIGHSLGRFGVVGLLLSIGTLSAHFALDFSVFADGAKWQSQYATVFLEYVVSGLVLMLVVVPEGVHVALSLALSHAGKNMLKQNILVRHVDSCETLARANSIVTAKTGVLTSNRMEVARSWFCGEEFLQVPILTELHPTVVQTTAECIALASESTLECRPTFDHTIITPHGSPTEGALLIFLRNMGKDYEPIRERFGRLNFNTSKEEQKFVSVEVADNKWRTQYVVGAAEVVIQKCKDLLSPKDGIEAKKRLVDKIAATNVIGRFCKEGLRTLCLAYRKYDSENPEVTGPNLTCICIVGISDPLRQGTRQAVDRCLSSGLTVRMVTGDHLETAVKVATDAGIFDKAAGHIALDGAEFRRRVVESHGEFNKPEFEAIWPRLRVLSRCNPQDRLHLVQGLQRIANQVVLATGTKANFADISMLETADIGVAIGQSSTGVAKNASDIIALNERFQGVVDIVMWGHNIRDALVKYLQFHITASVVVLTVTALGCILLKQAPFTPVQMLWFNIIADLWGCLVLATEPSTQKTLPGITDQKYPRLLSSRVSDMIAGQGIYQILILLGLMMGGSVLMDMEVVPQAINVLDRLALDHSTLTRMACVDLGLHWAPYVSGRCVWPENGTAVEIGSGSDDAMRQRCERNSNSWNANTSSPTAGCSTGLANMSTEILCTGTGRQWHDSEQARCIRNAVPYFPSDSAHLTLIFNACTLMTIFNVLNCRKICGECNILQAWWHHRLLFGSLPCVIAAHVVLIQFGSHIISGVQGGLSMEAWLLCFGLGISTVAWGCLLRVLVPPGLLGNRLCKICGCGCLDADLPMDKNDEFDAEKASSIRTRRQSWYKCYYKTGKRYRSSIAKLQKLHSTRKKILSAQTRAMILEEHPEMRRANVP